MTPARTLPGQLDLWDDPEDAAEEELDEEDRAELARERRERAAERKRQARR